MILSLRSGLMTDMAENITNMPPIAIFCYDFDGTLIPGNMQEYGLIQSLGFKTPGDFWGAVLEYTKQTGSESVLSYMKFMADCGAAVEPNPLTKDSFRTFGEKMEYFRGVEDWFDIVNSYAESRNISTEHYISSSGLSEILEGTSIARHFKAIFASSYIYENNIPVWPSRIINYTGKTQYLYRISKGAMDLRNDRKVNSHIPDTKKHAHFSNIIYIGDGETDIPCMQVIKNKGGVSVAVYDPEDPKRKNTAEKLKRDGRVQYALPADYTEGERLMTSAMAAIDRIAAASEIQIPAELCVCR